MKDRNELFKLMKVKEYQLGLLVQNKSEWLEAHLQFKWGYDIHNLEDLPQKYYVEACILLDTLIRTANRQEQVRFPSSMEGGPSY